MAEVAAVAKRLGLYYRSERSDGSFDEPVPRRLVVSNRPITQERANSLRFQTGHPCWKGTVAVTLDPNHGCDDFFLATEDDAPGWAARWGEGFLFGDPGLIRQLTEHPDRHRH
jgi:hypothetical protein